MSTPADPVDVLAHTLPVLGVGASLSFGVEPDPVALARSEGGPDFIEYAGAVDPAPVRRAVDTLRELGVPVLYHPSCLNLCGPWKNPEPWLAAVDDHVRAVGSAWLAQDVSVCFVGDTPGYSIQLGYFIPPERTEAGLAEAVARVAEVRSRVGAPLLLEPAPASFRWGAIPMLQWLDRLCAATGCGMLLDAGHVLSHMVLEGGTSEAEPFAGVDLRRVFEVHVAGGILHATPAGVRYQDAHELPIQPEVWGVFVQLLRACPNLKAVCVECEGAAAHTVLPVLERVRQAVAIHAGSDGLRRHVRTSASPAVSSPPPPVPASLAAPQPAGGPTAYPGLVRLLFDGELRARLDHDRAGVAAELDVPLELLAGVDLPGLALDADGRCRYLMSALCRAFPLSSALVGSRPGGAARLSAFLMSPSLFGPLRDRTAAFGQHLERVATLAPDPEKRVQQAILATIAYERALAGNAATVREVVEAGGAVPAPRAPSRSDRRHGELTLPPHTIVVELPQPVAALQAALDGLTAADAWQRLERGAVEAARVRAVLRSEPSPVTVLARAHAVGHVLERGASGGAAPLVDVSQRTVELRGRKGRWLQSLVGERLVALPPAHVRLATQLVEAGVLGVTLRP